MGKWIVYRDRKKEWRFRYVARNGQITAVSSESYKRKASAYKALASLMRNGAKAAVFEIGPSGVMEPANR